MHKHLLCFFWTMLVARTKLKLRPKMTERFSQFWLKKANYEVRLDKQFGLH